MATVITDPDDPIFKHLFTTYTDSAWQLLTLQHYNDPRERTAFRRFLTGDPAAKPADAWTTSVVTPAVAKDKDIGRVHVIERTTTDDDKLALTDYLRFALHRYQTAKSAGEAIRIAWTQPGSWPRNIGEIGDDFWLFDEDTDHGILVKRQYYDDGAFRQAVVIDDAEQVKRAAECKHAALAASKPFYP